MKLTEQEENSQNKQNKLISTVTRLVSLYMENVRLTTAEKLTILLSGVAIFAVVMSLVLIALIFIAIGLANLLDSVLEPFVSYFIIAGLLLIFAACVYFFKDTLVINPVARFISRLFVNPPKTK